MSAVNALTAKNTLPLSESGNSNQESSKFHLENFTNLLHSLVSKVSEVFTALLTFIKNIIHGLFSQEVPSPALGLSTPPEIDPKKLSKKDPFAKEVFIFNSQGSEFKQKRGFELITRLFQILGGGGPWHWFKNRGEILRADAVLKSLGLHPLNSLYFLFLHRPQTENVVQFQKNASDSAILRRVLALVGRDNPWKEFTTRQVENFNKLQSDVTPMVPGFCKALALKERDVKELVAQKNWRDLIQYVFNERKKHFKIS